MIEITDRIYRLAAARLKEAIGSSEWFNGSVGDEVPSPAVEWCLTLTAIIYRRDEILPEGTRRPISDIVPVWWEFSTATEHGAVPNTFSFTEFKPYLIDYD